METGRFAYILSFGCPSECISARDTFRGGDSAFLETLPSLPSLNMALFSFHIRYHLSEDSVDIEELGIGLSWRLAKSSFGFFQKLSGNICKVEVMLYLLFLSFDEV